MHTCLNNRLEDASSVLHFVACLVASLVGCSYGGGYDVARLMGTLRRVSLAKKPATELLGIISRRLYTDCHNACAHTTMSSFAVEALISSSSAAKGVKLITS